MRGATRIFVIASLLVLQQAMAPFLGARSDPSDPPPKEDPCESLDPSPSPTPTPTPSPSPSPSPDEDDQEGTEDEECIEDGEGRGGKDGGGNDGDGTGGGEDSEADPAPSPGDGGGKGGGSGGGGGSDDGGKGGGPGEPGGASNEGSGRRSGGGKAGTDAEEKSGGRQRDAEIESPGFFLGGPQNTARLIEILSELTQYGVPLRQSLARVVGPFPVAGLAWWTDDWHACRDGCSRYHKGLDIFAREGTPLVAAADGVVTQKGSGGLAGMYVEITDEDGVEYFYAHLSGWPDGIEEGTEVELGDVVGFVGNTGNAITTPPHVHFEIQPDGVPAPPKPLVDRWLRIAERRALELVRGYEGEEPISLEDLDDFRLARLFDLGGEGVAGEGSGSQLLLLAGLQPAASSFEMARRTLDRMAWEIDWGEQIEAELAVLMEEYERAAAEERMLGGPLVAATRPEGPEVPLGEQAELGD